LSVGWLAELLNEPTQIYFEQTDVELQPCWAMSTTKFVVEPRVIVLDQGQSVCVDQCEVVKRASCLRRIMSDMSKWRGPIRHWRKYPEGEVPRREKQVEEASPAKAQCVRMKRLRSAMESRADVCNRSPHNSKDYPQLALVVRAIKYLGIYRQKAQPKLGLAAMAVA
jgi:hypothetical protein